MLKVSRILLAKEKWDGKKREDGKTLMLLTPEEFDKLPNGTKLTAIDGEEVIKGKGSIDKDVRFGHMAYGVWEWSFMSLVCFFNSCKNSSI